MQSLGAQGSESSEAGFQFLRFGKLSGSSDDLSKIGTQAADNTAKVSCAARRVYCKIGSIQK